MRSTALILALSLVAAAQPAAAQTVQVPTPPGEPAGEGNGADFALVPAEGRHLKIDRRTGAVSICSETDGTWSCRLVADDRRAYEEEIERLEAANRALGEEVARLEEQLSDARDDRSWLGPEDERKLDEFFDFSDKAIRRFFGMVEELKRDLDRPDTF